MECDRDKALTEVINATSWLNFRSLMKGSRCSQRELGGIWRNHQMNVNPDYKYRPKTEPKTKPIPKTCSLMAKRSAEKVKTWNELRTAMKGKGCPQKLIGDVWRKYRAATQPKEEKKKKRITRPTPLLLQKYTKQKKQAKEKERNVEDILNNITMISGPVVWYLFEYGNTKYVFFGDIHRSRQGDCVSQGYICTDLDDKLRAPIENRQCYTIPAYLDLLLSYNNENNISTNVFVENPMYRPFSGEQTNHEILRERVEKGVKSAKNKFKTIGYLDQSLIVFVPCTKLDKSKCPYSPNVLVHNIDIRIPVQETSVQYVAFEELSVAAALLAQAFYDKQWIYIDKLLDSLEYVTNGMLLYIKSHFVTQDFAAATKRYLAKLKRNNTLTRNFSLNIEETLRTLTSKRNNKVLHKIAVQLLALRAQGKSELSQKITRYIMEVEKRTVSVMVNAIHEIKQLSQLENEDPDPNRFSLIRSYIEQISTSVLSIPARLVDAYTLARMFRFESEQVIVYTGIHHTLAYATFFEDVLSVDPTREGGDEQNRCISNFSQN